ncbi:hypothetical protein M422DRAFT_267863 [Sphaerobolus stellatus SS14]|uniref:F-box domain-containing protein n=1 Tax=Sphaerobolus stellatus (strain SS14) TaxID=990650 RepID=A0A0C9UZN1_SPHS4|nr:hypothetical protein M422DRAFT_267863 [Sphaerobolus stellatus SS14]
MPSKRKAASNSKAKPQVNPVASSPERSPSSPPPSSSVTPILLALPTETIHHILSHIPDMNLPVGYEYLGGHYPFYDPSIPALGYVRQDALRTLSQTCRSFRKFFLPSLWEHFNVFTKGENGPPSQWYKRVSGLLERGSLFLADPKNKNIAGYVRVIRVVLTRHSTDTVLPAFVACLSALPNLHTLHVLHAHSQMTSQLKKAFEGHSFPSIKKIILPSCAHEILRCCPEVTFMRNLEEDGSKIVGAINKCCKKVEILERVEPNAAMIKRIVKAMPNLKRIMFRINYLTLEAIPFLSPLKHLTSIDLIQDPQRNPFGMHPIEVLNDLPDVKAARKVLKGPEEKRRLGIVYLWQEEPAPEIVLTREVESLPGWVSRIEVKAVE